MTTKRRVLLDGNGSTKINVEGLGVYVPAIEHDHLKQKLSAEIQQLKDQVQAMQLERSTHVDDIGIDRFTNAMRVKMAYARAKGRCGWRFVVINAEGEAWYIDVKPDAKVKTVGKNKDGA